MMRLFFAITLSDELQRAVTQFSKQLHSEHWAQHVRWVPPENFHITLRFIGSCEETCIPTLIKEATSAIQSSKPFTLELNGLRLFPSPSKPEVLTFTVTPNAELFKLAEHIELAVVAAGFKPETRGYFPHLTLGRFNRHHVDVQLPNTPQLMINECRVENVTLFKSERGEKRQIYTALKQIKLKSHM